MKFSTCFGALSGKNLISMSPNFVLMIARGAALPASARGAGLSAAKAGTLNVSTSKTTNVTYDGMMILFPLVRTEPSPRRFPLEIVRAAPQRLFRRHLLRLLL